MQQWPHLSGKIFQHGGQVYGGTSADASSKLASLDKPSNPAHGELQSRLGAARNGLLTNSPSSRHFYLVTRTPHCKNQPNYHSHRNENPFKTAQRADTCKTRTNLTEFATEHQNHAEMAHQVRNQYGQDEYQIAQVVRAQSNCERRRAI